LFGGERKKKKKKEAKKRGGGGGEGGAYSAEFVRHGLLGRDVTYRGTELPTFQWSLLASYSLVEIYRPLEGRSVSCIR